MDFTKLKKYLDNIDKNMVPSYRCIIKKGNETIFEYFNAQDDIFESEKDKKYYYIFSASKVITCTALMRLYEEGKLDIEDPVYKYIPEFKDLYIGGSFQECAKIIDKETMPKAKNVLTIKNLLTMSGGYTYNLGHPEILKVLEEKGENVTTLDVVKAIAKFPLMFEPGENFNYSLCHDIIGAIIEVVSGKKFSEYLDEIIFKPLGMKDTTFRLTDDIVKNMHTQYLVHPGNFIAVEQPALYCPYALKGKYESGGAGLISTAEDYAKFASCLANGVSEKGYRILKRETIDLMRKSHLSEEAHKTFSTPRPGYSYGLGVRTHIDPQLSHSLSPVGEYGWDGAAGAFVIIDPENKFSLTYTQHVLSCGYCYSHIHQTIRNLAYEGLKK